MKHFIVGTFFLLASAASHAQTSSDTLKPKKGDKQVVFAGNSNSGYIAVRSYLSSKWALRYGLDGNYSATRHEYSSANFSGAAITYNNYKISNSNLTLNLFVGVQKNMGNFKHIEPYIGMDLRVGNTFRRSVEDDEYNYSSLAYFQKYKSVTKGAFNPTLGLVPFIGFNYYVAKSIALGLEYRISALTITLPGNTKSTSTMTNPDGTSYTSNAKPDHTLGVSGGFSGTAYLTLTFALPCKR